MMADKAEEVPGILWRIDADHEAALDRYEGYRMGLYDKCFRKIRTANGDYVFIRPAKKDLTEDKTGAEEARLFVQRVSQRNAYFTGIGLVQEVVPAPVQAK